MEIRHLQHCSPYLCRLRTDGLAPASKYGTYWSHAHDISLVNRCSIFINRSLAQAYCFNGSIGRETGWHTCRLGSQRAADCVRSRFSRVQYDLSNSIGSAWNVATGTTHRQCTSGVRGQAQKAYMSFVSGFPLQCVHRFELSWLLDMSNHLSYGSHHVDNLMELLMVYVGIINLALL
jgi:hypothetical protein